MKPDPALTDWAAWRAGWEARMDHFVPDRPSLIRAVLDVAEELLPADAIVIDLGSGPGSLAGPLLDRLPGARCLALDLDPVMLALGRATVTAPGDRIRWEQVDLRAGGWADRARSTIHDWTRPPVDPPPLAAAATPNVLTAGQTPAGADPLGGPFDAVVTLSALHHLAGEDLIRVYRQAAGLIRPGGVLINGDFLPFGPDQPALARLADALNARRRAATDPIAADWWDRLRAEPALAAHFAERDRLFPPGQTFPQKPLHDLHLAALRDAGFAEVGTVWQHLDKRVIVAWSM